MSGDQQHLYLFRHEVYYKIKTIIIEPPTARTCNSNPNCNVTVKTFNLK